MYPTHICLRGLNERKNCFIYLDTKAPPKEITISGFNAFKEEIDKIVEMHKDTKIAVILKTDKEAKKYANLKGVKGLHLDYLRYPGNAYKTKNGTSIIKK